MNEMFLNKEAVKIESEEYVARRRSFRIQLLHVLKFVYLCFLCFATCLDVEWLVEVQSWVAQR